MAHHCWDWGDNFLKKDYSEDVRVLNQILSKSETADLRPEAPPIPFTGNPWSKVKNECTLLVGINPKWHEPGSKTGQYECEISKSIELIDRFRDGDNNAFNEYINQRNNYFQEGFEYGGHFTYIANRFIENWYNTDKNSLYLTDKENEIFKFLINNLNSAFNKKQLLSHIWRYNEDIDTHTLETHIYTLRKKIKQKLNLSNLIIHEEDGYRINQ